MQNGLRNWTSWLVWSNSKLLTGHGESEEAPNRVGSNIADPKTRCQPISICEPAIHTTGWICDRKAREKHGVRTETRTPGKGRTGSLHRRVLSSPFFHRPGHRWPRLEVSGRHWKKGRITVDCKVGDAIGCTCYSVPRAHRGGGSWVWVGQQVSEVFKELTS